MQFTTVYRAEPASAQEALLALRRAGVTAELVDVPSPVVWQKSWGIGLRIQVAVPESEVERAREVLQHWAADSDTPAEPFSRTVGAGLLFVLGPPIMAWAITSVPNITAPGWLLYASVGWVVVAVAVIAVVRRRAARVDRFK